MRLFTGITVAVLAAQSLPAYGQTLRRFEDPVILALERAQTLLPPPDLVEGIAQDLAAIRAYNPYFETIHASPRWEPGVLLVGLLPSAWDDYLAGSYHGLDSLNAVYGPPQISVVTPQVLKLAFDNPYNPEILSGPYDEAPGVWYAEPDHVYSTGGGTDIYFVDDNYAFRCGGPGYCPAGCNGSHVWILQVVGGEVHLIDEYGCLLVTPTTWGRLKELYLTVEGR